LGAFVTHGISILALLRPPHSKARYVIRDRKEKWRCMTQTQPPSKAAVSILISSCGLVWVPLLFNRVLYWDDWAHYWIFWVGGLEKAIEMYMQVAHPGHVVPVPLFYSVAH
jgi:hypothetical protein